MTEQFSNRNERFLGLFIAGSLAVMIAACWIAPRLFSFGPSLLGLLVFPASIFILKLYPSLRHKAFLWALFFPAMALTSGFWSVTGFDDALERSLKLAGLLLPGLLLIATSLALPASFAENPIKKWTPFAVCFLGLAIAADLAAGMPITGFVRDIDVSKKGMAYVLNRSTVAFILILLPVSSFLDKKRATILVLCALPALFMTFSQSAQLAALVIIISYFLFPYRRKWGWAVLMTLIPGLIFSAPWLTEWMFGHFAGAGKSGTWLASAATNQRLEVWDFIGRHIQERPLYGYGVEATRSIHFDTAKLYFPSDTVLHPHNFALQLWIEFGVLGALAGSAFFLHLLQLMRSRLSPEQTRIALPTFLGWLSIASTGYGLWQGWWIGLGILLIALVIFAVKYKDEENS